MCLTKPSDLLFLMFKIYFVNNAEILELYLEQKNILILIFSTGDDFAHSFFPVGTYLWTSLCKVDQQDVIIVL